MAKTLISLPLELLSRIFHCLSFEDRLRLSMVNTHIRVSLVPLLFKCIRMTNKEADIPILDSLIQNYGEVVTCVSFVAVVSPWEGKKRRELQKDIQETKEKIPKENDSKSIEHLRHMLNRTEQALKQTENIKEPDEDLLPGKVRDVLEGNSFKNLEAIIVKFDFDFDDTPVNGDPVWEDESHGRDSIYVYTHIEDFATVEKKEEKRPWRKLMAQAWKSIASNKAIRKLSIPNLIARLVSTFRTPEWEGFLAQLIEIDIKLAGGDNGVGWHANTELGYIDFESKLDEYFFKHMRNVERVRLSADPLMPVGLFESGEHRRHCPVPLRPEYMPKLVKLELCNIFVDPALVEFLKGKANSPLKKLTIHNGHAACQYILAENPITWAEFFKSIRESDTTLTEFIVTDIEPNATILNLGPEDLDSNTEEDHTTACGLLKNNPQRRVFTYGQLSDKYGDYFEAPDDDLTHFRNGSDQKEYDELMAFIAENAERFRSENASLSASS